MKHFKYIFSILSLVLGSCASKSKIEIVTSPKGAEVLMSDNFVSDYKTVGKTPVALDLEKNKVKGEFVYLSVKAKGYKHYNLVVPKKFSMGKIKVKLKSMDQNDEAVDKKVKRRLASVKQQIEDDFKSQLESAKYNHATQLKTLNDQLRMSQMLTLNQTSLFDQQKRKIAAELEEKNKKHLKELEEETKKNVQVIFNKTFEIQNALQNKRLSKAGKALAELKSLNPPEGLFLTLEGNFEFLNGRISKALASYKRALTVDPTNLELATIVKKLEKAVGT